MNVHISYKAAKTTELEREFAQHLGKLEKRLQVYRPELVHLHATVEPGAGRGRVLVALNLRLPTGQMAAQERGAGAVAAAKRAFSELLQQLSKHQEQLRNPRARGRGQGNGGVAVPYAPRLAAHPQAASGPEISRYIDANTAQLLRFIARELRYRVNLGQLEEDQLAPEEVLNEAVAAALSAGREKPEAVSMGRWMYRLATQAIARVAGQQQDGAAAHLAEVHLEASVRQPNVRASDEPQLQYHQPDESFVEETVIADPRVSTPEQIVASEEAVALMEQSLLGASRADREAFVLYAIEGFTVEEIAAVAGRMPEQVQDSLRRAHHHLARTLSAPAPYKQKLLRATRIA